MRRRSDWRRRLEVYVENTRTLPFSHSHYCGLWTANAVEAMTGEDHAASFRHCRTRKAALRAINREGFLDHVDKVRSAFPEIAVATAAEGDIAVVDVGAEVPALGIVQGSGQIYLIGDEGLMMVDLLSASTAFRV